MLRYLSILLFTFTLICVMSGTSEALILDHILDGVSDIVGKEVAKIETKIDEFITEEVQKVKHELMVLYVIMILINMVYSTVLIFAARKYLNKE